VRPGEQETEVSHRNPVDVLIRRVDEGVSIPSYEHPGDAGVDLVTTVGAELAPGERRVLPTGIAIALPDGYAAFVHPRSGLAARCGVSMVNTPGTIDAGYRGEIKVIVVNLDPRESVRFERFDRIAQLVVQQVEKIRFHEVAELPGSARANGGFGSTGGHAGGGTSHAVEAMGEGGPVAGSASVTQGYASVAAGRAADRASEREGQ
jgi:dUTP pyrophosphatase